MIWLLATKEIFDELLHLWNTSGAAHKHNLINFRLLKPSVFQDLLYWAQGLLEEVIVDLLEACSGQRLREVNASMQSLDLQKGQVCRTQHPLGLLNLVPQLLDCLRVLGHIFPMLLLKDPHEVLHHTLVKVFASKVNVSVCCHHSEYTVVNRANERHVKSAPTEIID
mmetsp:Transcript_26264/g.54461  ORF Transcript_26264/g.54461 Transcript_26264/m.54461 type:complete len:167 (-) Transcript_26264:662-1162(-)